MSRWDPWRGCHRCSEGCRFCYIHKGDAKKGIDTNKIIRSDNFDRPIQRKKSGEYKMSSGLVYVCFSSDFLIEEADEWRIEAWKIIRERQDCTFLFLTKRVERFMECIPSDWGNGYDNVAVGCTVENQEMADYKLPIFQKLPIKHKYIIAQPLLGPLNIEKHLNGIELVDVGGESDKEARVLDYEWVLNLRDQCIRNNVTFHFRQCGSNFLKDGKLYKLQVKDLCRQAKLAGIDFNPRKNV